ncbi:alpha/beta hydrolase [Butyrivibrio sp. WCE2006]|uniref:alpha/beta hydrolase n=1 Tax=Butyrivibrio sp. WCE2006 TaxID=1410611 RepID=UPI00067878C8|nr:alpha/beta hydrolase [Butyrivibrio sp. WCE2006]
MNPVLAHLMKNARSHSSHVSNVIDENVNIPVDLEEVFDREYLGIDGNKLFADIYRPKGRYISELPIVIFAHGGGLFIGNRKFNRLFCEILAKIGYLVFSIDYRLIDEADAIGEISDVCSAIKFVTDCAEEFGGDINNVFLIGESAGAFLSLYASVVANSDIFSGIIYKPDRFCRVKGLICISGMLYTTLNDPIGMVYKDDLYGKRVKDKSFMKLMNPNNEEIMSALPPIFLITSSGDFLKRYSLKFAKKLKRENHMHELVYFKNANHLKHAFISMLPLLPESAETLSKIKKWTLNLRK